MAKTGWTKIHEDEYNRIKLLQEAGLSMADASKVTGRSILSIRNVYRTETYEDNRALIKEQIEASNISKKKKAQKEQITLEIPVRSEIQEIIDKIDYIIEKLENQKMSYFGRK